MKRSMARDMQQTHVLLILVFALLLTTAISGHIWELSIKDKKTELFTIATLIQRELADRVSEIVSLSRTGDAASLMRVVEPGIRKVIDAYPPGYVAGFYSSDLDRVCSVYSRNLDVNLQGRSLPLDDPGRSIYTTGQPRTEFLFSPLRNAWIIKCDYPVIFQGGFVGHAFVNYTLRDLVLRFSRTLGFLVLAIIAGAIGSWSLGSSALSRVRRNVEKLRLLGGEEADITFDYPEFDEVAKVNHKVYQDLVRAEQQKAQILANFPGGYLVVGPDGTCLEVNEYGAEMNGANPSELKGEKLIGNDYPMLTKVLQEKTAIQTDRVYQTKEGDKVFHSITFPVTLDSGEAGVMSWFLDVTNQKTLELAVQHMDRLSTVGEMTSIIAHDIRNPLASIKGLAQLGKLSLDQAEKEASWQRISDLITEVNDYLERILTFARPNRGSLAPVSVRYMFENVMMMLKGKLSGTEVALDMGVMAESEPFVYCNQLDFQYALLNLVNNAFEAMVEAGRTGRITLTAKMNEGLVEIRVSDQGPGIPSEDLGKIWGMFFSTKAKGTGVGLAMVKRVVEQCQGEIWVDSSDQGTTFTITVPGESKSGEIQNPA